MFDPTIFDNLKVVLEGDIYDLDLDNVIQVIDRKDLVDLATMSRHFQCTLQSSETTHNIASTIYLKADSKDLYTEILELDKEVAGCTIEIDFNIPITDAKEQPIQIGQILNDLWGNRPTIRQQIYYSWQDTEQLYTKVLLSFTRKIGEEQISDFKVITNLVVESLYLLEENLF